jgi:hypothetical protein
VRGWEIAIDRGEAHFVHCPVPAPTNSRPATVRRIADLPSDVVILASARGGSVEVATAQLTWEVGDVLVVLTRLSDVETRMLFAPDGAQAPSTSANTGAAPSRTGIV